MILNNSYRSVKFRHEANAAQTLSGNTNWIVHNFSTEVVVNTIQTNS